MLLQEIGKGFIGQFLKRRHPVARQLPELVESVVVKGDQFAHAQDPVRSQKMGDIYRANAAFAQVARANDGMIVRRVLRFLKVAFNLNAG